MLPTRRSRLAFVTLVFASIVGAAGGWASAPEITLRSKVFVPSAKSMGFDERSPTGRVDVTWMFTPAEGPPCYKNSGAYLDIYRNAIFCDTIGLEKARLGERLIYFRKIVDDEYVRHYQSLAGRMAAGVILAWLVTVLVFGVAGVVRWVQRGEPS